MRSFVSFLLFCAGAPVAPEVLEVVFLTDTKPDTVESVFEEDVVCGLQFLVEGVVLSSFASEQTFSFKTVSSKITSPVLS